MKVNTIYNKNILLYNFNNSNNFRESKGITNNFPINVIQNFKPIKKPHPKCKFTSEEDELLKKLVTDMINSISQKSDIKSQSCTQSDEKVNEVDEEINNVSISPSIISSIDWNEISKNMKTWRNARQCRERWINYLSPSVVNGPWTIEEEDLLRQKYNELGPRWKKIALFFPTRTDINVKSHYHLLERRIKKEEKKKLKALQKQKGLEESAQKEETYSNIDDCMKYETDQANAKFLENPDFNIISSTPLPNFQITPTSMNPIFAQPNNSQFEIKDNSNGQICTQNQKQQISNENGDGCGSPLPIFSIAMQEADREYESNINECWNSLLMNDDNNEIESFFDKWL